MTEYVIVSSWGESTSFSCDPTDLGEAISEAIYVAWEMEAAARLTYAELVHRLDAGIPTVFTYHGVQPAELTRAGNFFFLTDI